MLKFNRNTEERKTIATRLGELTGMQPFYTRAPRYAYEIGPYTVDRDGNLFVDEEQADADILTALMNEGLITGGEVVGEADDREPDAEPDGTQEAREDQDGVDESEETEDSESTRTASLKRTFPKRALPGSRRAPDQTQREQAVRIPKIRRIRMALPRERKLSI